MHPAHLLRNRRTRATLGVALLLGLLAAWFAVPLWRTGPTAARSGQYTAAAAQGSAESAYALARHYQGVTGGAIDLERAHNSLRQAAQFGHRQAQLDLAFLYHNGNHHVAKNLDAALEWFRKAAANGAVVAQCMLGDFHRDGLGGARQDGAEALRWYRLAAETHDPCAPKAMFALYEGHLSGRGAPQDLGLATKWLRQAAEAGHRQAQATLGRAYRTGQGVEADPDLERHWLRKSREGQSTHDDPFHDLPSFAGPRLQQKLGVLAR
jgi:TPR repeat protein